MAEIILAKTPGGTLAPIDQDGVDYLAKLKLGAGVRVKVVKANNIAFHRKCFALLGLAFDAWDCPSMQYKGESVNKTKEQFREDITILSGYYTSAVRLDGSVRLTAKSWAFENMDDEEKEAMYNAIINVVLAKVLTNYTRDDLDTVIENLLRFT